MLIRLDCKDELLVMLFTNKKKTANPYCYHIPWDQETIPTSRVSLASTLCTQGLFYPCCRCNFRSSSCVEDSSGGHRRILVSFTLDYYFLSVV